jgi:hypothetical protein
MVKGFFFNRVDAEPAGAAISRQEDLVFFAGTDKTHSPLLLLKLAEPWAEIALYTAILQPMPVFGRISRDLVVNMWGGIHNTRIAQFMAIFIVVQYSTWFEKSGKRKVSSFVFSGLGDLLLDRLEPS